MRNATLQQKGKIEKKWAACLAGAAMAAAPVVALGAGPSPLPLNNQFLDWNVNNSAPSSFVPSPFLSDSSAGAINTQFISYPAGTIKAVKVVEPLTTGANLFNQHAVSYVFGDLEASNWISQTATLVNQVRGSTLSDKAYVGNYAMTPLVNDPTSPSPIAFPVGTYAATGVNMANNVLYPGSASFRSPAAGNSTAPNIRSAMFVLPVWRQSAERQMLPQGHLQIPWYNNFEGTGSPLNNGTYNGPDGPRPAFYTSDQLLSRGDTKAQVLHLRMRDVTSLNLFNAAIVYQGEESKTQEQRQTDLQNDVKAGWMGGGRYDPAINPTNVFTASDRKAATMAMDQTVGTPRPNGNGKRGSARYDSDSDERNGTVWSGRYSMGLGKLDILVSNLDSVEHWVDFGSVNGFATTDFIIDPASHYLLTFDLQTKQKNKNKTYQEWVLSSADEIFIDNNRAGIGIPEPASVGIVCLGAMLVLPRRRRA